MNRKHLERKFPRPCQGLSLGLVWVLLALLAACQSRETAVPPPPFGDSQPTTPSAPPDSAYNDLQFAHIGIADGLSNGVVTDILQDRDGFLWIATYEGLNRYDGYHFITYQYHANDPHSISGNLTWRLLEAQDGALWIATQGYGVSRFDPDTEQFTRYRHDNDNANSLSDDYVQAMLEDDTGNIWFGTVNGLDMLDVETGQFTNFRNDFDPPDVLFGSNLIEDLAQDAAGVIWVATRNGLLTFDPQQATFAQHEMDAGGAEVNAVGSLFLDKDGILWVGTLDGLFRVEAESRQNLDLPSSLTGKDFSSSFVYSIYQDLQGVMWFTNSEGLYRWHPQNGRFQQYRHDPTDGSSLSAAFPRALFTDESGTLWVGSSGEGLNRFDPWQRKFQHVQAGESGLSSNEVWTFAEDKKGRLWIGTDRGLDRWDRVDNNWAYFHAAADDAEDWLQGGVYALRQAQDETFWLVTDQGLARFDPAQGQLLATYPFVTLDPQGQQVADITLIFQDRAGQLWLGTARHGLAQFDRESGQYRFFQTVSADRPMEISGENAIWDMIEDGQQDGRFWMGTQAGLARFENGSFTFYPHNPDNPNSPSHNAINSVYQDEQGGIWLGTGDGLNYLEPASGQFRHYFMEDGLPTNSIYDILPDGAGNLWISSNRGLTRFDPRSESFRNFDIKDGLQGLAFHEQSGFVSGHGELFFAGGNGFNYFDPADIQNNAYIPRVVITDLSIANKSVPISPDSILQQPIERTTSLNLSYRDMVVVFELAALHFSAPENNQYAYIMEGFDEEWNYLGNRRYATYTNLPPGSYTFRAIGSNGDGVWNTAGTAVPVIVAPPWWSTPWFRLLMGMLGVGLIAGAYTWRVRSVEARSAELAREVEVRTAELSALYTITAVVSSSLDLDETLAAALDKTLELMACEAGAIHLRQEQIGELNLVVQRGLAESCVEQIAALPVGGSFVETAVQTGQPQIITNPHESQPCVGDWPWLAVTPLIARGQVLGTLFMSSARQPIMRNLDLFGSIGNQIGIAIENARLFAAERLRAEQFQLISQVSHKFSAILDIDEVLAQVVRLVQESFGYYHVGIGLVEGDEVVYRVGAGELWENPDFDFWPPRLKIGQEGLTGWVAATKQPALVPDVSLDSHYVWMRESKTRSELIIPLLVKDKVIGVLDLQSDQLNDFDEMDLTVMRLLAGQVAIAVENARLYEQAQQLAVVEERNRLARDLHDSVTQSIYSLTLLAEAGQRMIRAGDELQIAQNQARLGAIAQQALQEMRLLVYELRPLNLREVGLLQALEQRLEVVERRAGVEVRFSVPPKVALPPEIEDTLYHITHEALNNALKHASATAVSVSLKVENGAVILEVQDNGRGFEPVLAQRQGGLGLLTMRERAETLHGRFQLNSAPDKGATVCVELPLLPETAVSPAQESPA